METTLKATDVPRGVGAEVITEEWRTSVVPSVAGRHGAAERKKFQGRTALSGVHEEIPTTGEQTKDFVYNLFLEASGLLIMAQSDQMASCLSPDHGKRMERT